MVELISIHFAKVKKNKITRPLTEIEKPEIWFIYMYRMVLPDILLESGEESQSICTLSNLYHIHPHCNTHSNSLHPNSI